MPLHTDVETGEDDPSTTGMALDDTSEESEQMFVNPNPSSHPYPPLVARRMMAWLSTPQPAFADSLLSAAATIPPTFIHPQGIPLSLDRPSPTIFSCPPSGCPWSEGVVIRRKNEHHDYFNVATINTPLVDTFEYSVVDDYSTEFMPAMTFARGESPPDPPSTSSTVTMTQTSPQQPVVSSLVATYLILIVVISVAANTVVVVVRVCGRRRHVRSSHVCTLCLAVSDIAFSLLVHTLMILAALGVDPMLIFNVAGCNYYGFSAMFFGTFSMCIHASVSVIRYINICHPEKVEWLQLKYVYLLILGSFLYSVAWALGPLFHWGRYETFEFGCTLAFSDPTRSGRSFVTCAFIFVLLLPLGVVMTCYFLIVLQANKFQWEMNRISDKQASYEEHKGDVRNSGKRSSSKKSNNAERSLRLHYKLVRMSMVVAIGYVVGWLPYAVVCMWATYGDYTQIPEGFRVGASLFCKSATAYNPFIYYFMSEGFRADLRWLARKAGLPVGNTTSESTFYMSGRSSTRSSAKKSRDRTRENSLNHISLERKDSNSTCIISSHLDAPSTPLSLILSPEQGEHPLYTISNKVPVTSIPRRSSGCSHASTCASKQREAHKNDLTRRISETSLSPSKLFTNEELCLSHVPRRRLTNSGYDIAPLRYHCRRSVSFSLSPTASPDIKSANKFGAQTDGRELPMTHRSFSFYGFRDNKMPVNKKPK